MAASRRKQTKRGRSSTSSKAAVTGQRAARKAPSRQRRPIRPRRLGLPFSHSQRLLIGGLVSLFFGAVLAAGLATGQPRFLAPPLELALGWGAFALAAALVAAGVCLVLSYLGQQVRIPWIRAFSAGVVVICGLALTHLWAGEGGGRVGEWAARGMSTAFGRAGASVILLAIALPAASLACGPILEATRDLVLRLGANARELLPQRAADMPGQTSLAPDAALTIGPRTAPLAEAPSAPVGAKEPPAIRVERYSTAARQPRLAEEDVPPPLEQTWGERSWRCPAPSEVLSDDAGGHVDIAGLRERARLIEETMRTLNVPASVVEVNPGPRVTQFGLEPGYIEHGRGDQAVRTKVRVSQIESVANDLALALAAPSIRIEAPVPGRSVVGVEVPNPEPALVSLRGVVESDEFRKIRSLLAIALGRGVSGDPVVADLATLPHLLIAGATGSGKSACINALAACLLCYNTPDTLRLIMIDPKRVELTGYDGIPHLLAPTIVDVSRVPAVLQWLLQEMDRRYVVLARARAREIEGYNRAAILRGEAVLPHVVVFIDELADLMMAASEDVERKICRLAQMSRATGIHLVIATQRPSVDVLTGLIKANLPARLAFAVTSQVDSRVILDSPGAEKLLGRGDALFMKPDWARLVRMQGCFVGEEELARIISHWREQAARGDTTQAAPGPDDLDLVQQPLWPDISSTKQEDEDPLLSEAIALVRRQGRASASLLQRAFRIGYTRAARLIDALEERGVVGPAQPGGRPREVLPGQADEPSEEEAGAE